MNHIYSPCRNQLRGIHNYKLTPEENWAYWQLMNLGGTGERAGYIEKTVDVPYTLSDIAYETNLPPDLLTETINKLIDLKWLASLDGIYILLRWDEWQIIKLGETKAKPKRKVPTPEVKEVQDAKVTFDYLDKHPEVRQVIGQGQIIKRQSQARNEENIHE